MEFQRWFADKGDLVHRLNYNLNKDSVVFDVGGYRGDFAAQINQRYGCKVYVFEPVEKFYESIVSRFANNPNIVVCDYGLAERDQDQEISVDGDASSIYKRAQKMEVIQLREIGKVMQELSIDNIDLIKINIEGGEFPLLSHCIESELTSKMKNIQVQFHSFVEDALVKRHKIRQNLKETHSITYDYAFVWENWYLKGRQE
jgi:FkbM family methyltransferase